MHIIGNLKTYIGKEIGKTNYIRNRDLEFSDKNISRKDLIQSKQETINMINNSLQTLNSEDYQKEFPVLVFAEMTSIEYLLVHLVAHLTYHLGQINYHRRLI